MKLRLLLVFCALLLFVSCRTYQARRLAETGYKQLMDKEFPASSASFAKAGEKDSSNQSYRYNYLLSLFLEGRYDEVIGLSEQAFADFAYNLSFLLLQAESYAEKRDYRSALQVYDRLFALDPASYETQAAVMEKALLWKEDETAKRLALGLLGQKKYEKQALTVLSKLSDEASWYASALAYITTKEPAEPQPTPQAESK